MIPPLASSSQIPIMSRKCVTLTLLKKAKIRGSLKARRSMPRGQQIWLTMIPTLTGNMLHRSLFSSFSPVYMAAVPEATHIEAEGPDNHHGPDRLVPNNVPDTLGKEYTFDRNVRRPWICLECKMDRDLLASCGTMVALKSRSRL
ncbi:hypothetical protein FOFC_20588 [Fusarium oxysporum]|nr:hypothetical protein FOFC_20588 [Fusarium oxysporum]